MSEAVQTVLREIEDRLGYRPCGFVKDIGKPHPIAGVLNILVCGLPPGHEGQHSAGWTGTGQRFG